MKLSTATAKAAKRPVLTLVKSGADARWNRIVPTLVLLVLIGVVGNVIYAVTQSQVNWSSLLNVVKPVWLLLGAAMLIAPILLHAFRIRLWSRVFGQNLKYRQTLTAVAFNDLGAAITPTAMGGGWAKGYFLYRNGFTAGQAALTMMLGSVEDCVFLISLISFVSLNATLAATPEVAAGLAELSEKLLWLVGIMAVGVLIVAIIPRRWLTPEIPVNQSKPDGSLRQRLLRFVSDLWAAIKFVARKGRATFLATASMACLAWTLRYSAIVAILYAFGITADFWSAAFLNWCVFTVTNLVATPGGMGGAEASFAVVFADLVPASLLPLVTAVWRFMTFYLLLLFGTTVLLIRRASVITLLRTANGGRKDTRSTFNSQRSTPPRLNVRTAQPDGVPSTGRSDGR